MDEHALDRFLREVGIDGLFAEREGAGGDAGARCACWTAEVAFLLREGL